jgi:hypothetical protein
MPNMIQAIFLNDLMIVLIMGMAILAITSWAFRYGEYTGYALGWLIGFFFVVVFGSMVSPNAIVAADDADYARLSILTVFFSALFGLATSVFLMTAVQVLVTYTRTTIQTWLIVIGVGLVVSSGYLMLITSASFRLMIAIFVLALAITMLLVWVLHPRRVYANAETADVLPEDELGMNSTTMNQIRRLQERFQQEAPREPYL